MYYAPYLCWQSTEGWPVSFVMKHLGSDHLPKSDLIVYMQRRGTPEWLRRWKLHGTTRNIKKNRNCKQLVAAYKVRTHNCNLALVCTYVCMYVHMYQSYYSQLYTCIKTCIRCILCVGNVRTCTYVRCFINKTTTYIHDASISFYV